MPVGVVKTPHDEKIWEQAKASVGKKQAKNDHNYWKHVMGIFKMIKQNSELKGMKK